MFYFEYFYIKLTIPIKLIADANLTSDGTVMEKVIQFYESRIAACTGELEYLKRRIYFVSMFRLSVFVVSVAALWFFRHAGWPALTCIVTAMAVLFAALVTVHSRLFARKRHTEALIQLNSDERRGLDYDFGAFDGAPEESDTQHAYGFDLDVFGEQSLFRSVNRTVTCKGKALLVDWFKRPLTAKAAILRRQEAVREMGWKVLFRQRFCATGLSGGGERDDILKCGALFAQAGRLSQSFFWRSAVWIVPAAWLVVAAGIYFGGLPFGAAGAMCVAAFFVGNMQGGHIRRLHRLAEKLEKVLCTYSQLIGQIEREAFHSVELREAQGVFVTETSSVSRHIARLSDIVGALDQRFSLAGLLLNMCFLRDVRQAMRLEAWITMYAGESGRWLDALARVDTLCSLGGFAFNHPDIADAFFRIEGKALGHPLLHRDRCVKNDVSIARHPFFLIVTGANMAGKSTYLRTVGVNFLLACMGLPACAESFTVYPAHLVTSLRTSDSLVAHESYFFAELKRLKMIIDRLHAGDELFIVLDEILKGTNSRDKQTGSLALMKQLIALDACGIIATHDLLLGMLENEFPDSTCNCCFEADVADDRLTFTYRLRPGIARNMNATFLMKKMGITL
jgi:hypothetical protein